jgi:hypothetical protein
VTVGAHDDVTLKSRRWQDGTIIALAQIVVIQMSRKQFLDQLSPGAAAGAMAQVDTTMLQIKGTNVGLTGHRNSYGKFCPRPTEILPVPAGKWLQFH